LPFWVGTQSRTSSYELGFQNCVLLQSKLSEVVQLAAAVKVERPNEHHANRPLLGVCTLFRTLPHLERNAVEQVMVSCTDWVLA
jgi:hypothetical protein